jgi:hypothetical protein
MVFESEGIDGAPPFLISTPTPGEESDFLSRRWLCNYCQSLQGVTHHVQGGNQYAGIDSLPATGVNGQPELDAQHVPKKLELLFHHQSSQIGTIHVGIDGVQLDRATDPAKILRQHFQVSPKNPNPAPTKSPSHPPIAIGMRRKEFVIQLIQQTIHHEVALWREWISSDVLWGENGPF